MTSTDLSDHLTDEAESLAGDQYTDLSDHLTDEAESLAGDQRLLAAAAGQLVLTCRTISRTRLKPWLVTSGSSLPLLLLVS